MWLGDLNYRVEQPNDVVRRAIADSIVSREWSGLIQYDQLKLAQRAAQAFADFVEALFEAVRRAVSVLYNVSGEVSCYDLPSYPTPLTPERPMDGYVEYTEVTLDEKEL